MDIAILHPALDISGGAERQVLSLANELEKFGNDVTIYTCKLDVDNCYPHLSSKLDIIETGGPGWSNGTRYVAVGAPIFMRRMAEKINSRHDIINCHNSPTVLAAYLYKQKNRKPIVWMCNDPPPWYREPKISRKKGWDLIYNLIKNYYIKLDQRAVSHVDRIIVLDSQNKKLIEEVYGRKSEIIRTGLDIEKLKKAKKKFVFNKYDLNDKKIILTVNRLEDHKRIQDFIYAINITRKHVPNVLGVIVGEGSQKKNLVVLSKRLDCQQNIIFAGRVDDKELISWYKACDIFVFPTIQTWGISPLEAMVCGKPAIVSLGAGVSEVLKDGVNSLLVPPKNPRVIAQQVEYLINNKEKYNLISKNGKKFVEKNLSWKKYTENILNIFQRFV